MPTIGYDFERVLAVPAWKVRNALATTLRELGFRLTSEQLALIEGRRGSRKASLLATVPHRLPVTAIIRLERLAGENRVAGPDAGTPGVETGTRVVCRFEDAWGAVTLVGITVGVNWAFQRLFEDLRAMLDSAMASLDPDAASAGFPEPRFWNALGTFGPLEALRKAGSRIQGAAIDGAVGVFDGPRADPTPQAWRDVELVRFVTGDGRMAEMTLAEVQAHLVIAVLAQVQPGSSTREQEEAIERVDLLVETALNAAPEALVEIRVGDADRRTLDLLNEQVRIRKALPVRELHVCTTCRNEQVTNPDLARLMRRIGRLDSVVGVGATVTAASIQPFVVVGSLLKLARLEPDWVCARCQGLSSTEGIVTYCPACGGLRREAILGICPDCGADLRSSARQEPLWGRAPSVGPTGGRVCEVCGREFAALWRVVEGAPAGPVERFVCGIPPGCAVPSIVPPARV